MARAEIERDFLKRFAADETKPVLQRVKALLTLHGRLDSRSCGCDWNKLGSPHAGHQAEVLQEAGLLKEVGDA